MRTIATLELADCRHIATAAEAAAFNTAHGAA
jgi:hypothetical protein